MHHCAKATFLKRQAPIIPYRRSKKAFNASVCIVGADICCEIILRQLLPSMITILDERIVEEKHVERGPFARKDIGVTRASAMARRLKSVYPVEVREIHSINNSDLVFITPDHPELDLPRNVNSRTHYVIGFVGDSKGAVSTEIDDPRVRTWEHHSMTREDTSALALANMVCSKVAVESLVGHVSPAFISFDASEVFPPRTMHRNDILSGKSLVIMGIGGVGSNLAEALVRSCRNVRITVFEHDIVECHNLSRQTYRFSDIGKLKVRALSDRLKSISSDVRLVLKPHKMNHDNSAKTVQEADLVFDGLDRYKIKHVLNKVCVENEVPMISGGTCGNDGYALPVLPGKTPCFAEVFPIIHGEPTCASAGVLFSNVLFVAELQRILATALLSGSISSQLNLVDFRNAVPVMDSIPLSRNSNCTICSS